MPVCWQARKINLSRLMNHIAFIGAGHLANALISGLSDNGYSQDALRVADIDVGKCEALKSRFPAINTYADNTKMVENCGVVVLCVKPDDVARVCAEIGHAVAREQTVVISVAAGVTLAMLTKWLNGHDHAQPLLRCMPNLPVAVGQGMSVLCANEHLTTEQRTLSEAIFSAVGETDWVQDERLMDLVTALSGSGPAYFFRVMQSLEQAAKTLGMEAKLARQLIQQTALGAALFACKSPDTLTTLCAKVASKGGTTERALEILEQAEIDRIFAQVLSAATARAAEISAQIDKE